MPGLLTHLSIALIGFSIIYFGFYKSKKKVLYGSVFFIGHLLPDFIDFGIAGIKEQSLNPAIIMTSPLFHPLAILGHTFTNWLIFSAVVFFVAFIFFKVKKIPRRSFNELIISITLLLIATFIHIQLDKFIIETSYWI